MVACMILTGAPGAGKSSTLQALAGLLEREGVGFGAIEAEQLAWGSPRLSVAEAARQLAAVLAFQRDTGRGLFLVAAGMETAEELERITGALVADRVLVVGLAASPDTLAERLARREALEHRGDGTIVERARALAELAPRIGGVQVVIHTDRLSSREVAARVRDEMTARGLLPDAPPAA